MACEEWLRLDASRLCRKGSCFTSEGQSSRRAQLVASQVDPEWEIPAAHRRPVRNNNGPRGPALREFWLSAIGLPALVVSRTAGGFEELSLGLLMGASIGGAASTSAHPKYTKQGERQITKKSDRLARRPAVGKVNCARGEESAAVLAGGRNIECKVVAPSRGRAKHLRALRASAIVAAACDVRGTCEP